MSTLNAKASNAYYELVREEEKDGGMLLFDSTKGAFEEGWETGYKAAAADMLQNLRALRANAITAERQNAYDRAIEAVESLS